MVEIHNFTQSEVNNYFLKKIIETALGAVQFKGEAEISVAIVGDGRMRKLNKLYRGKNRSTDVLSFSNKTIIPYLAKAFPRLKKTDNTSIEGGFVSDRGFVEPADGVERLGEIIICYPRAKKQAKRAGHSLKKELAILLIHGAFHLFGYDHEQSEEQAEEMREKEKLIFSKLKAEKIF